MLTNLVVDFSNGIVGEFLLSLVRNVNVWFFFSFFLNKFYV